MNTKIFKINPDNPQEDKLAEASEIIKKGGIVAFPTETVYGLGANALNENAVSKIFEAKGRPSDNPLIVHVANIEQVEELVEEIPQEAYKIMESFWPGPITIIFNKSKIVPDSITAGLPTVAIRMPNHKIALDLINKSELPIAAPSANLSGKPSPTTFEHVKEDLTGKIDAIIEGGFTGVGLESTVVDITTGIPTILRPGGITREDLLNLFSEVKMDPALHDSSAIPKSPGQKYKHYSPNAKVYVIQGMVTDIQKRIELLYNEYSLQGLKVGIMATKQTEKLYEGKLTINVGDRLNPETIASNLFKALRNFDDMKVDIILAEAIDDNGIGAAIMNRLNKSAGGNIITAKED